MKHDGSTMQSVNGISPSKASLFPDLAPDVEMLCPRLINAAATFRDRGVDGNLLDYGYGLTRVRSVYMTKGVIG